MRRGGLAHLLRYLDVAGFVASSGGPSPDGPAGLRWEWTERAIDMGDDWYEERLRLDGTHGLRELGLLGLLAAVRTGSGPDPEPGLRALGIVAADDEAERRAARLAAEADGAVYLAGPLAEADLLAEHGSLRISGRGADEVALALHRARPDLRLSVLVDAADAAGVRERLAAADPSAAAIPVEDGGLFDAPDSDADAHLLVDLLDRYPDDAAIAVLRRAREACRGGRVVLVGEALDAEALDEHECEDDLVGFSRGEAGLRTRNQRDALIERAGLQVVGRASVGWGFDVRVLA